jgi:hypothetical protein
MLKIGQLQAYRLVPWAWSAAWLLTGLGFWISIIKPLALGDFIAYIALGALGWGMAGLVSARAANGAGGTPGVAVRLAGWGVASLVAILLGLVWMLSWDAGFVGPMAASGLAGAIGGLSGSVRKGAWRLLSGLLLGVVFLLLAVISFYAGYILWLGAQPAGGRDLLSLLAWLIPAALCGLGAGFAARWILGLRAVQTPGFSENAQI